MSADNLNRRHFLKVAAGVLGAAVVASKVEIAGAEEKRRAKKGGGGGDLDLPIVKPGEGVAGSLNYQHTHDAVKDAKFKVDRAGVSFDKQKCSGCVFYAKVGDKDGGEVGKCQLIAGFLVKTGGWCSSWNKKPG